MDQRHEVSRRTFVVSAAAAAGGMALGFHCPGGMARTAGAPEINAWIVIEPDDTVIIRVARSEMGQGVFTALPMLVAEELECDFGKVRPEFASPSENRRRNRPWGDMSTGASNSVSGSQQALRRAGATARHMLIAAAAARWKVPASECRAHKGEVLHPPSGRRARFGKLAALAATMTPPADVALKPPSQWTLIGTPQKRIDVRDKVTGQTVYAADVRLPNMLYAALVLPPVFKGTVRAVEADRVAAMTGVRRVVVQPDFVAVVADSWWRAKRAADVLPVTWSDGGNGRLSSAAIAASLRQGLEQPPAGIARREGDAQAALDRAVRRIEADYVVPYLAHATMEPQNCTAHVAGGRVEIWVPTQDADTSLVNAADAAGVSHDHVVVHKTMLGGGFGRRGAFQEFVRQAVLIAKEVGQPVQLLWSREQDIRQGFYRPMVMARQVAGLDRDGAPLAWLVRVCGQSIAASVVPEMLSTGFDRNLAKGYLADMPYAVPNILVDGNILVTPVPVGPWRGLDYTQNAYFRECFIDEMAHAAGRDPYLFRRALMANKPRHLATLDAAAAHAGWGSAAGPHRFRGIAVNEASGSVCAQVVEIANGADGELRILRIVSAIDAGHMVNPLTIEQQTQSAVIYGLTAALHGEISIKDGRVEQSNFHDYEVLRMAEVPPIETVIVPSGGTWGGVGELPLAPLAPALCNAVFAATGKRIRSLPLSRHGLRMAAAR